ncbi:hypothetical protein FM106_14665 [Brachybacterium faecium]|nr:hypothetical protein FM106_14665 [Brachybacterium faecium]
MFCSFKIKNDIIIEENSFFLKNKKNPQSLLLDSPIFML